MRDTGPMVLWFINTLPVWHSRGTLHGSLEQNYLFMPPSVVVQACGPVILKSDPPAFRISELGNQVQIFRHFLYGFQYGIKLLYPLQTMFVVCVWGVCYTVFTLFIHLSVFLFVHVSVHPSVTFWFFFNILNRQWWKFIKFCRHISIFL